MEHVPEKHSKDMFFSPGSITESCVGLDTFISLSVSISISP